MTRRIGTHGRKYTFDELDSGRLFRFNGRVTVAIDSSASFNLDVDAERTMEAFAAVLSAASEIAADLDLDEEGRAVAHALLEGFVEGIDIGRPRRRRIRLPLGGEPPVLVFKRRRRSPAH